MEKCPASGISFSEYRRLLVDAMKIQSAPFWKGIIGFARSIPDAEPLIKLSSAVPTQEGLVIVAGFHGEEPAGPLCLLRHLNYIFGKAYRFGVPLDIYPVMNPYGFDYNQRITVDGNFTNAGFVHGIDPIGREAELLRDDLKQVRPKIFLDLHEDIEETSSYLYVNCGKSELVGAMAKAVSRFLPLASGALARDPQILLNDGKQVEVDHLTVSGGQITDHHDGSSEDFMSHQPGVIGSFVVETPAHPSVDLDLRIKTHLAVIEAALEYLAEHH